MAAPSHKQDPIGAATEAVAKLADVFAEAALTDIRRLEDIACCEADDADERAAQWALAEDISHNLKGQAPSFGYDLVGEIATRLNRICRKTADPQDADFAHLADFADAMRRVLQEQLTGDGGELGASLLMALETDD